MTIPYTSRGSSEFPSQLKSEGEILEVLKPIYAQIGGDPAELVRVTPSWGGWLNALRFCVFRTDGAHTWVARRDLDHQNRGRLINALRSFSHAEEPACDPGKTAIEPGPASDE